MTVITKNNKEIELWINSKLDDLYLKNFLSRSLKRKLYLSRYR